MYIHIRKTTKNSNTGSICPLAPYVHSECASVATGGRVRESEEERQRETVPGGAEGKGSGGGAYLNMLNH